MSLAEAVQMIGLESALWALMYSWIAPIKSLTLLKLPRLRAVSVHVNGYVN